MPIGRLAYMPEPGVVEIREYELPALEDGAMLLETVAAGVCGSEVHMYAGRHPLRSMALGHEIVGRVSDPGTRTLDSAGQPLRPGDHVAATYFQTCLRCPACGRGEFHLCANGYANWLRSPDEPPHFVGTHATHYYVTPRQWVYRVPDAVPALLAASANCALAQVVCAMDRAGVRPGEHVLVQGAGGLGLYATALAKERGATVTVMDGVEDRLRTAMLFGSDHVVSLSEEPDVAGRGERIRALTRPEGVDVAFDLAGVPAAVTEGLQLVRPGGRYMEIGNVLPDVRVELGLGHLTRNSISLIPVIRYHPRYLLEALAFLARNVGRLPFERLVDGHYSLDDVQEALEDASARRVNRAAILFDGAR